MSLWIRSRLCSWLSALARPMAKRKNRFISIGPWIRRLSGSPPGFSRTSTFWSLCWDRERGRTAHAGSSSFLNKYSCSNFLRLSGAGRVEAVASRRTDGASARLGRPRDRMNSSSSRSGSRTYSESSTVFVPRVYTASVDSRLLSHKPDSPSNIETASHSRLDILGDSKNGLHR